MALGPAQDQRLAHLVHGQCRLHPRRNADGFQCVLHGERVHHRGQHAHVIGGAAVHALGGTGHAAKNIAATDHQTDIIAGILGGLHLARHPRHRCRIDPERLVTHRGLARQLQQDALVGRGG